MNTLSNDQKTTAIRALIEGNGIRSTERMTGIHRDTIMRLLVRTGESCVRFMDEHIKNVQAQKVQVDEIWTFVAKKEKQLTAEDNPAKVGDQYVFVSMDSESKLIPSFFVGKRNGASAWHFVQDLQTRLSNRVQLTTDAFRPYLPAVEDAFGANVDYAMLIKTYQEGGESEKRYSPGQIVNALPIPVTGNPKPHLISTLHIERQNLTIRMQLRRFTRLTNAFSKKLENLKAALALHFAWYNFCRVHSTLRVTPAMTSGIADHLWDLQEPVA
jgi:IS1 family transposase